MSDAMCPLPEPLDYKKAKATYSQVRKDTNYKLSPEANRREASRRLGADYETFTRMLTTKGKGLPTPSSIPVPKAKTSPLPDDPQRLAYDKGYQASKTTRTYELDSAADRFAAKHGRQHEDRFIEGWTDYASDYEKYTSFRPVVQKPTSTGRVPEFIKSARGGYTVEGTFKSGRKIRILVSKSSWANATAQGGVSTEGWTARFGAYTGDGKTRMEALEAMLRVAEIKGTPIFF